MRDAAQQLMDLLKAKGLSVVTAESCTAGLIAGTLSRAKGAGDHLHGGFVTYTKAHKHAALGLDPALMDERGTVNEEVARLMASQALARSAADLAVAATGVAGPAPDEHGVPLGTLFIATVGRDSEGSAYRYRFAGTSPDTFRARAVAVAIAMLTNAAAAAKPSHGASSIGGAASGG